MAFAEIHDQLHALLTGADVDAYRALPQPLARLHDAAEKPESWYASPNPSVQLGYLLLENGDPGSLPSHKIGQSIEQVALRLELVAYAGGEMAVTAQRQELDRILMTTWEQVKSLLAWPGNLRRSTTGWWTNHRFTAAQPTARQDRLVKPCSWVATYAYQHQGV